MELIKDIDLVIGKKYSFPVCSIKDVTAEKTIEHHLIFLDNEIIFRGEYKAVYHNEEDENTGVKKDAERHHAWLDTFSRRSWISVNMYKHVDEDLFVVTVEAKGCMKNPTFMFYTEAGAEKMFSRIHKYIFEPDAPVTRVGEKVEKQSTL